jgi:protein-disulfide isomerase
MTRDVKTHPGPGSIENAAFESYNRAVSNARISGHFLLAFLVAALLGGGACEKKPTTDTGAITAADRANPGPVDTTPLAGIDASKLDAAKQKSFYALVGALNSPCGKAHNLRKSVTEDTSCKRAPFAAKYVLALVEDEAPEARVREMYAAKYEAKEPAVQIDVSKAPRVGNNDAPVRIVEFFDYACSVCQQFKPVLDKVVEDHGENMVVYYMMYPTGKWPDSPSAGQAAIAAARQGKLKEMHDILFTRSAHHRAAVMTYAQEIGLDLEKFTAAYEEAAAQVKADGEQGEKVGVHGTPAIFLNERRYTGPIHDPRYLALWVEEEVVVNR